MNQKQPITKGYARVPIVMQMETLECGAASLAMVLAYYGKWLPLEEVRSDCGVSRDGSKAKNIAIAARHYGLSAKGYRYEPDELRRDGHFPCIIHWNFNHFVVLAGFAGDKAVINDPAKGLVRVPMKQFDESFTGICILFEPTADFEPSGKPTSVLAFVRKRLKGTFAAFVFIVITSVISSVVGVINPAFSRVFMDVLLPGGNDSWLLPFVGVMCAVALVQIVVECVKTSYILKVQGKLAVSAGASFLWHVIRLPMSFFSQRMSGDIAMRQQSNEDIAMSLISQLAPMFLNFGMLIFYLAVMLRYSIVLTLVGVISVVLNIGVSMFVSQKRVNITRVQMRDSGRLAGATVAGIEMIETLKASGAESGFFSKWSGYQAAVNTSEVKFAKLNTYLGAVPMFVSQIANIVILMLGIVFIMDRSFTVGMLLVFQGYIAAFNAPAQEMISVGQSITETRTSMERIEDVMSYGVAPQCAADFEILPTYEKLSGNIELKDVSFGYSPLEPPLIRDFNLTTTPGQRVAIVGGSGCGKSTVAKLISGLYPPAEGEILFDGVPIDRINHEIFTSSVAVVDQEITLFADTISNNIKMWDSSIEDFEMIMAARDAQMHEVIMQRDGGYRAIITDGGRDFSGGQRQRLEIARVLAGDPTIVILDEATSALDAKTEYNVVKSIVDRGITCIIIAHRLSTIRDCDDIIVMDHGVIVERGKHEELYGKGGLYSRLVSNE